MVAAMAIVAFAILGSVWLITRRLSAAMTQHAAADEKLRERFARGEITGEQFDEAKERLG
jgi:uncharacterized membrane protein